MNLAFPSYSAWIVKSIYKVLKTGVKDFYNKVKEISEVFCWGFKGSIIALYIINAALLNYEDKRVKKHGYTLKGMKQAAVFFWMFTLGISVILISSLYGMIFYLVSLFTTISYLIYSDQKDEFYKNIENQKQEAST